MKNQGLEYVDTTEKGVWWFLGALFLLTLLPPFTNAAIAVLFLLPFLVVLLFIAGLLFGRFVFLLTAAFSIVFLVVVFFGSVNL